VTRNYYEFDPSQTDAENLARALWELVAHLAPIGDRFQEQAEVDATPAARRRTLAEKIVISYAHADPERIGPAIATYAWKQAGDVIEVLDRLEALADRPASAASGAAAAKVGGRS
jgi:hypothetical protein